MGKKCLWLLPVLLLLWDSVSAQQSIKLKKANQYFEEGNYRAAIPLYEEVLGVEDMAQVKARLAESYRFLENYSAAAQWYALVVGLPGSPPEYKFYYGMMLLNNGDCEGAERWFKDYLKYAPYDPRKPRLLDACNHTRGLAQKLTGKAQISLPAFNSPNSELGPAYYENGLTFSVFRKNPEHPSRPFLDLVMVSASQGGRGNVYSSPKVFSNSLQSNFDEGFATFNSEETEIFVTRTRALPASSNRPSIRRLEIASARRLPEGGWSKLEPLPFSSDNYSIAHPSLSKDGKRLYFSSDMPGGYGGKDLYLSFFENGQWGPPINLGPTINTADDEIFPFISDSGKLYFSSNGYVGLGGQDIFWTRHGPDGLWETPENMGHPINSEGNDFGIILKNSDTEGYFTSNRSGGAGKDDIYAFQLKVTGTLARLDLVDLDTGDPIPNARVVSSCTGDTLQAGPDGRVFLRMMECCTFTGHAGDYRERSVEACGGTGDLPRDTFYVALALPRKERESGEVEAASQHLLSGVVFNQETGSPVFQAKVRLISADCLPPPTTLTDKQGRFSLQLEPGCCYQVKIERDNFFAQTLKEKVCTSPGERELFLNANLLPYRSDPASKGEEGLPVKMKPQDDVYKLSRSSKGDAGSFSFLMNVYYDLDRSSIQKNSVDTLLQLLHLMRENPNIVVEVSAHTDSQGEASYNQELSQKRAENIVRYLVKKGISTERLVARGLGESQLANHCADEVPCSEEEHQQNRRTEFRVLGKIQ